MKHLSAEVAVNMGSILDQADVVDGTLSLDLWYPGVSPIKRIELGLTDVRAADSILIEYDFERDG